jgi:myo-inositol-1(or 4)-monophosphatase
VSDRELLELATEAAQKAGILLLDHFHRPAHGIEAKSTPTDLVSDADRASEELILEMIRSQRPEDGILAEEGGGEPSESGLRWVVDPLDGTVNFLFRLPEWSVSIAVEDEDGTRVAVTHIPNRDETFTAVRRAGAALNGAPISVSDKTDLADALVGTGFAYDARARSAQSEILSRVLPLVRDIRRAGSAAIDLSSLACGRFDGFYEAPMERWDRAAGELLIAEAGGVVSDLPAPYGLSTGVIAANPALHDQLRELVLSDGGSDGDR